MMKNIFITLVLGNVQRHRRDHFFLALLVYFLFFSLKIPHPHLVKKSVKLPEYKELLRNHGDG